MAETGVGESGLGEAGDGFVADPGEVEVAQGLDAGCFQGKSRFARPEQFAKGELSVAVS